MPDFPAGLALIVLGLRQGALRKLSSSTAPGRLLTSEIEGAEADGSEDPVVHLEFEYEVDSQSYRGQQVVDSWPLKLGGNLVSFKEQFNPGREIVVLCDPERPVLTSNRKAVDGLVNRFTVGQQVASALRSEAAAAGRARLPLLNRADTILIQIRA